MADSRLDQSERQQMIASAKALWDTKTLRHKDILFYWLALLYIIQFKNSFPTLLESSTGKGITLERDCRSNKNDP